MSTAPALASRVASLDAIEYALAAIGKAVKDLRISGGTPAMPKLFERDVERHHFLPPIAPAVMSKTMTLQSVHSPIFIIYDFETTGLGKTSDVRIRQIGARAVCSETLKSLGTFTSFVKPGIPTSEGAKRICKIDAANEAYVEGLETWAVTGNNFNNWMQKMRKNDDGCPVHLIAHNGKRFDARILTFENARHKINFNTFEV